MRQSYNCAVLIFSILVTLILSSCGSNNQQANNTTTATTITASETALIETSDTLSAVRANDGTSLWSIKKGNISKPLAVSANHLYYSTSSNVAAVDLTSGKELWSKPISGDASDLQVSSGLVYILNSPVGGNGGLLSAFDATSGALKWHVDNVGLYNQGSGMSNGSSIVAGGNKSSDFIIRGSTLYTAVSGVLTALDAITGSQLWQFTSSDLKDYYVDGLLLSADNKKLVVSWGFGGNDVLYAVQVDSHQEAWHLHTTTTTTNNLGNLETDSSMTLSWFTVTPDNHVLYSAAFGQTDYVSTQTAQDGYHYVALSDGSDSWFLPLDQQNRSIQEGTGQSLLVGDSAFYTSGGPSGGDVSATSLSNHQQVWNTPGSGSYGELFLDNDVLLASSGASFSSGSGDANGHTLTAFNTQNGKQIWQLIPANNMGIQEIFTVGQRVFIEEWGQTQSENPTIVVFDLHSGKKLWSMPTPVGSGQYTYWAKPLQNVVMVEG